MLVGSIADQTGAPLPGVRLAMRGAADRTAETGPRVSSRSAISPTATTKSSRNCAASSGKAHRAGACRPTGHRVVDLARRHCGRNDRHRRESRRARRAGDADGDQRGLEARSRSSRNPDDRISARARAIRHLFAEHRLRPAHDPRHRRQRRVCRIGPELGHLPRWRLPRPAGDGVRAVSRPRSRRSAAGTAGHLVWTQRGRRRDQPRLAGADERAGGCRAISPRETSESSAPTRASADRSSATG